MEVRIIKPYFAMGRRPRKKHSRARRLVFFLLVVTILLTYLFVTVANNTIVPVVTTIATQRSVTMVNEAIDYSLNSTIYGFGLTSEDFYALSLDNAGRLNSLSVDTILVNQVASILAVDISQTLSADDAVPIAVPMGLFTGIPIFAGLGPNINVNVVPTGEAVVQYETSFTSAGINQINFQVWLVVETNMRIVIPLQEHNIPVTRRVPLVNTVFAGEVPEGMLLTDFGLR